MADFADEAAAQTQADLERALAWRRQQAVQDEARPPAPPDAPRHCLDCGDQIAPARLAALPHARRCVPCQTLAEAAWL